MVRLTGSIQSARPSAVRGLLLSRAGRLCRRVGLHVGEVPRRPQGTRLTDRHRSPGGHPRRPHLHQRASQSGDVSTSRASPPSWTLASSVHCEKKAQKRYTEHFWSRICPDLPYSLEYGSSVPVFCVILYRALWAPLENMY